MANTTYVEIFDLFLLRVKDWRLDALYESSETRFNTYLQGFLMLAIPDFDNCDQDLENRDDVTATFNISLSTTNKAILSLLMARKWLDKEIRDINQMNSKIYDKYFKFFSEAQNTKSKMDYQIVMAEEISQELLKYGYGRVDWSAWIQGNFG